MGRNSSECPNPKSEANDVKRHGSGDVQNREEKEQKKLVFLCMTKTSDDESDKN